MHLKLTALLTMICAASTGFAAEKNDMSTKVTAVVSIAETANTFTGRTLAVHLYAFDPFLADVGADLIEKIEQTDFAHTKGKKTELTIEIGARGKISPRKQYYVTAFVLDKGTRTLMGEINGKRGLCKVIAEGNPREINLVMRQLN